MIYVSQGHERGVGLEIFLKSFLCLSKNHRSDFILVVNKIDLEQTLSTLKFNYTFSASILSFEGVNLACSFIETNINLPNSTISLNYILNSIGREDILLTLPTSKDQLVDVDKLTKLNGHTEYFRHYYSNNSIPMTFISPNMNALLLTDHIDIKDVFSHLSVDFIIDKVQTVLKSFPRKVNELIFTGINPHCGEAGLISNDDKVIEDAVEVIRKSLPNLKVKGPLPADTIHFQGIDSNKLIIYAFHDQGLAPFKLANGLTGINTTFGLPFLRVSVDHGTAFDLYGKNQANYHGMLYLLNEITHW